MAALSLLGWRHLRRVPAEEEVHLGRRQPVPAPAWPPGTDRPGRPRPHGRGLLRVLRRL